MPFRTECHHETLRLSPFGDWTIQHVGEIERSLETLALDGVRHIQIDLSGIVSLDLSGAWLIHDLRVRSAATRSVDFLSPEPPMLRLVAQTLAKDEPTGRREQRTPRSAVEHLGRHAL